MSKIQMKEKKKKRSIPGALQMQKCSKMYEPRSPPTFPGAHGFIAGPFISEAFN